METAEPLLDGSHFYYAGAGEELVGQDGEYRPARGLKELRYVFWNETVKLWALGFPIAFSIICQYGMNTVTTMFAGHLGDVELSAISISLSIIGTFSFGFLVSPSPSLCMLYLIVYVYVFCMYFCNKCMYTCCACEHLFTVSTRNVSCAGNY